MSSGVDVRNISTQPETSYPPLARYKLINYYIFALHIEHCTRYAYIYIYGTILLATILKMRFVKIRNYHLIFISHNTETIKNRNEILGKPTVLCIISIRHCLRNHHRITIRTIVDVKRRCIKN